jgi:DNA-directed RNA polymerase sigma subunit (sigma70/sigma32)
MPQSKNSQRLNLSLGGFKGQTTGFRINLVVNIAEKHLAPGAPLLDLIQEGNIGLMNAVRSFAERPIGDFTAHAACIEEAIAKAFGKST